MCVLNDSKQTSVYIAAEPTNLSMIHPQQAACYYSHVALPRVL